MSLTTSSTKVYLSHDERTADDFRDTSLHQVRVHRVHPVNDHINTYQLAVEDKQNGIKVFILPSLTIYTYPSEADSQS